MLFNDKSVQYIFQKKNPALVLFANNETQEWNTYIEIMSRISEVIKGKLVLVMTDIREGIASRLADYVGIKERDLPLVAILDTRKDFKKYIMKKEIEYENIINFVNNWEENKLKRSLKSEKEPKNNNENVF